MRSPIPASLRPKRSKSTPLAPLSAVQKVERSWAIVSSDLESLGIDFFTRVFLDVPGALDLFTAVLEMDADEMEDIKESHIQIIHFVKENKLIKAHARLVIMEMGRCVAGLYDVTTLVPRLRSLGRMHGAAGVKPEHYDIFFKHLMAAVKHKITSENSDAWDSSTEEAWLTVRDCMNNVLAAPDKSIGSMDGGGNLNRWGMICGCASFYVCTFNPLHIAGMIGYGNSVEPTSFSMSLNWMLLGYREMLHQFGFALFDTVVLAIFMIELVAYILVRRIKVKDLKEIQKISKRSLAKKTTLFQKCTILVRSLGIHEAVMFPISDAVFLLSYLVQYQGTPSGNTLGCPSFEQGHDLVPDYNFSLMANMSSFGDATALGSCPTVIGVSWTWSLGVLRLVVIFRALYVLKCMELICTVSQRADRMQMRVTRLVLGLAYTSHVAACVYVLIGRMELGPIAYYDDEHPEQLASSFFPDYTIFGKENSMLTNYLRCVHFAFTNLSGMGNHDSTPATALECIFTLALNVLGATLYAWTTGLLLSMIEPAAQSANRFGDDAAALTEFMTEVGMSAETRDRFIQGFILREMSGGKSGNGNGPYAASPGTNTSSPEYPDELAQTLPTHLQEELYAVALVDAMKRRERGFRRCSDPFLTAMVSSLKSSVTLLPGDYIIKEGENVSSQLLVVEQGIAEVIVDGNYIRKFERGDMISFHWVSDTSNKLSLGVSSRHPKGSGSFSPLLLSGSVACASVRAMQHCRIATGLSSKSERKDLKKRYPDDWRELEFVLENAKGRTKSSNRASEVSAVSDPRVTDESPIDDPSKSKRRSRNRLTDRVRRISVLHTRHNHHDQKRIAH